MGKYAELAWCEITGGEPDFELWAAGADATRPDITGEPDTPLRSGWDGTRLHVKTCNMSNAFKDYDSWTAARWDQIVRAPAENDIILLSYTAPDGDTILLGWVYATDVAQHWEQCKIASMSHKRAIYFLRINKLIHDPTDTPRK